MGADATFRDAIYPIALLTGGPLPAPGSSELTFSVFPFNVSITFKPSAGCASPGGAARRDARPGRGRQALLPDARPPGTR